MSGRKRLILLVILLTLVTGGVAGIVLRLLYDTAVDQQLARLVDTARSQSCLMEAVARYDLDHQRRYHGPNPPFADSAALEQRALEATLSQYLDAQRQLEGFGETGEFLMARREGDSLVYVLWRPGDRESELERAAIGQALAEPMRRALGGESGTFVGPDHRGETVLAAYEPVAVVDLGVVAKMDLAEIRRPFVRVEIIALCAGLALIVIGTISFILIGGPLVGRLEESERKYKALFESAPIGIGVTDYSGRVLYANPRLLEMSGHTPEEVDRWNVTEYYVSPEARERLLDELRRNGRVRECEVQLRRVDGTIFEASVAVESVRVAGADCLLSMIRDITEQRRSAEALRESEERYRLLVETARDAIFTVSTDGTLTSLNAAAVRFTGFETRQWIGRPFDEFLHPGDRVLARDNFARLLKGEVPPTHELRIVTESGGYFTAEMQTSALKSDGRIIGVLGIARDVTERRRADDILRESEAFNRAVIEHSPLGITVRSPKGKLLSANEAWQRIWGISDETLREYQAQDPSELHFDEHDSYLGDWLPKVRKIYEEGGMLHIPEVYLPYNDPEARSRWVALTSYAINDADGKVDRVVTLTSDITERKQSEASLRESEERYRSLVENAQDPIYTILADGTFSSLNGAFEACTGWRADEWIGRPFSEIIHPDDLTTVEENDRGIWQGKVPLVQVIRIRTADGRYRAVEVHESVLRQGDEPVCVIGIARDITDRIEADRALKASEAFNRAVIEHSPLGITVRSPKGKLLSANEAWLRLWGVSAAALQEYLAVDPTELKFDKKDSYLGRWLPEVRKVFEEGGLLHIPELLLADHPSGQPRWISKTFYSIGDAHGNVDRVVVLTSDYSERRRAEESLRESEERYRSLVDNAKDAIFAISDEGVFTSLNPAFEQITGWRVDEWVGKSFDDLLHPDERLAARVVFEELLADRMPPDQKLRVRVRSGDYIPVELRLSVVARGGTIGGILGIARDVTEREQALERIRFLSLITEQVADSVIATDPDFNITYVNQSGQNLFGYTAAELAGKSPGLLNAEPESTLIQQEICEAVSSGRTWTGEIRNRRRDGTVFPCELSVFPLVNEHGVPFAYAGVQRDVTERKRVGEELSKAQKLESIGVLAGGIAHDFNNILTGVVGNVSLAKEDVDPSGRAYESLDCAEVALDRARELTQQLLTFSRGGAPVRRTVSVADIIRESARFSLHGSNVRYELDLPDDLKPVDVDAGQISQTLNNLIINADQAMPEGGVVTISARGVRYEHDEFGLRLKKGEYVRVQVADKGIGIPADHLSRIFDPFFTTKQKGSGLGLASAYSIVVNHGGCIQCDSQLGRGTTFSLYLPVSRQAAGETVEPDQVAVGGSGRILVMDDEELIRNVASRILTRLGYRVELASDGARAVALYNEGLLSGDRFDLVVLDLTIPGGMGGRETIRELRRIDPGVKAMVCSGYSNDPTLADFSELGFGAVVGKPFKPSELAHTVHELIVARRG